MHSESGSYNRPSPADSADSTTNRPDVQEPTAPRERELTPEQREARDDDDRLRATQERHARMKQDAYREAARDRDESRKNLHARQREQVLERRARGVAGQFSNRATTPLTAETSPTLRDGFAVGANTAAAMLIIFGDNPERIRSAAACAKLCGACPVPASSGMTTGRHRLYRGGHRQANAALHRAVVVRMRYHQPTIDYVIRRRADGRTKRDIIRCLTRFLAREIYQRVMRDFRTRQQLSEAS